MKGIFVAGGTGGHILPAVELGKNFEQKKLKNESSYIFGNRKLDFQLEVKGKTKHLDIRPLKGRKVWQFFINIFINGKYFFHLLRYFKQNPCDFALGTGGYVCGPVLLAARIFNVPTFILEQNSIMGLTNKILCFFVDGIFVNFHQTKGLLKIHQKKVVFSGNPTRKNICESLIKNQITKEDDGPELKLLVFGGSLGASEINHVVEELCKLWGKNSKYKLNIVHQTGNINNNYCLSSSSLLEYQAYPFIEEMGKYYSWADIILCRGGGGTIQELRIVKKPVVVVPYPNHSDRQQYFNALYLKEENLFEVAIFSGKELVESHCEKLIKILDERWRSITEKGRKILQEDEVWSDYNQTFESIFQKIEKICLSKRK